MANSKIEVGSVIKWGDEKQLAAVNSIRVIRTGQFVESFSGNLEDVVLTLWDGEGTNAVWGSRFVIENAMDSETKDFKARLSKKTAHRQKVASETVST